MTKLPFPIPRTAFRRARAGAVLAALMPLAAFAQGAPASTGAAQAVFAIRGFDVTGENPLSGAQTSALLAPFLREQASLQTLQKATAALEAGLREQGYGLYRVALPPQEVGSAVSLKVVKFVVGKVTVQGAQHFSEANIRASVPELSEGASPNFRRLAVQTAIANESPSKQLQVVLKESQEADKVNADIQVKDRSAWNFAMALSNTGSTATGLDRVLVSATHANVLDRDHQFVGAYTTSVERPGDVRQWGLNYRIPLYAQGGVLSLSHTRSDVVGSFGTFNSNGAGQTLGLAYSLYLAPRGAYRSNLSLGWDDKQFDVTQINGAPLLGQSLRRSRPLSLSYSASQESDASQWSYNAEAVLHMAGGTGSTLADYQSEDPRISSNRWRALRGGANYRAGLGRGWQWAARAQFQYSDQALISGEQFGLGGAYSVRGTQERPLSADKGFSAGLELTSPEWMEGLRFIGFVDGGWLGNVVSSGASKPDSDHLMSAGVGVHYAVGKWSLAADWGRVLTGSTVPLALNSASPQAGEQKLHVNITGHY